jgi:tetratricopeptide (TPR) repeat protein
MGPAHPESAYPLSGLAHLYARQGKYAEAEPLYQRALRIWEAQVGETHLLTGATRRALAELQEAQGHHEEARSGFERAWAVRTQVLGAAAPPTPEARQHLLALLRAIGQYEEVARLKAAQPEQGTSEAAPARLPEDEHREPPQANPESGQHLSENT